MINRPSSETAHLINRSRVASYQPEVETHSKKAKKASKEKSPEGSGLDERDSGSGRVPELANEKIPETLPEPSPPCLIAEPSEHATTQESNDICASQAEHLLNGNMWKNCNKCRALICRLSTELAQTITVAEEGFEAINTTIEATDTSWEI